MNYPGPGQPTPLMSSPPKKQAPILPIILSVVGLLIVLAVVGAVRAVHAVQQSSSEAIAVANSFIDNMGQHNYPAARSLFIPEVQARTPAGNLKDIETPVEKHHGAFVNHGQPQWNVQNWNGQTSVRLAYPAQFTSSNSTIALTLVQTNQGYQVYEAHYDF